MYRKYFLLIIFLLTSLLSPAQEITIKGNVKDATSGEGVSFANIHVIGTGNGTTTNEFGNFTLNVNSASALKVSAVGYKTDTVQLKPVKSSVSIVLKSSETNLNEVVISGTMRDAVE